MTFNEIIEAFNTIITTPLSVIHVYMLTKEWRFSIKKTKCIISITLIILLLIDIFIMALLGTGTARNIIAVLNFTAMLVLYFLIIKYQGGRMLFVCFSVAVLILAGGAIGEIVGSTVALYRLLVRLVIYPLMLFFTYRYFRHPFFVVLEGIEKGWHWMATIPISFCILLLAVLWTKRLYTDQETQLIGLALCFSVFVIYAVLYYAFCNIQEQHRIKLGYDLLQSQMHSLQKQLEYIREAERDMSILRHDIRHYVNMLSACVEQKSFEGTEAIINHLDSSLNAINKKNKKYTGNLLFDTILSEYENRLENENIQFEVSLYLSDSIKENSVDLAVVVYNAIENAYIACRKIPVDKERKIKIAGTAEQQQFFLEISNTIDGEVKIDKELRRPISSHKGHGYGTQSIAAFAEKYNAYVEYKSENGWFIFRLIL